MSDDVRAIETVYSVLENAYSTDTRPVRVPGPLNQAMIWRKESLPHWQTKIC
jgi:hypothetical protein